MTHLNDDLLIRHLDDELSSSELLSVELHLEGCDECRSRLAAVRRATGAVDDLFLSMQPAFLESERGELAQALAKQQLDGERMRADAAGRLEQNKKLVSRGASYRRRFEWVSAVAACLAAGVFYFSQRRSDSPMNSPASIVKATPAVLNSFDVDGEKFWALPYSNPDLPVTARVIQMEVPVASLADAGIVVEPLLNRTSEPDRAVLADILLGLDGQPVGVHVVSVD